MLEPKPKLSSEEKRLLRIKNRLSRRRVEFRRQEWFRYKKFDDSWRKPRGKHSKLRQHWSERPPVVDAGFRGPKLVRGLHPSGFQDTLIHNVKELEALDPLRQAARIASGVGAKKREIIEKRASELTIRVLNPGVKE